MNEKLDEMDGTKFKKKNITALILIVVLLSISMGLIVFYIANPFFNKPVEQNPYVESIDINDQTVRILYSYVTFANDGINRPQKLVMSNQTTYNSFTNLEKIYYALQFVRASDLEKTNKKTKDGYMIYSLSNKKVDEYVKKFFGSFANYSKEKEFDYFFNFDSSHKFKAKLTYNIDDDAYDVELYKVDKVEQEEPKFIGQLSEANRYNDGSVVIIEKVIYLEYVKNDDSTTTINVYADLGHTKLIESRKNLTEKQKKETKIVLGDYINYASEIAYTFKVENEYYIFDNSMVTNK